MPGPDRPRLVAVLNCFGATGANAGQLAIYADGTLKAYSDQGFIRSAVQLLITNLLTRALDACAPTSSPTSKTKNPKA